MIRRAGSIVIFSSGTQRFQPCQLKKREVWSAETKRDQGHAPLGKILRYVPLRCDFLHFEITVNGK